MDACLLLGLFFLFGSILGIARPSRIPQTFYEHPTYLPGPLVPITAFNPHRASPIGIGFIIASVILHRRKPKERKKCLKRPSESTN